MKHGLLLVLLAVSLIFMSGCAQQENIQINEDDKAKTEIKEPSAPLQEDQNILSGGSTKGVEKPQHNGKGCSDDAIMFEHPPVNLDKITHIEPMGSLHGEHVAPIDHQYYQNFKNNEPTIEVYSPYDGAIKEIQHMGSFRGDVVREPFDDYRLVIVHSCSI